jgi:phosphomevalonate kinase
VQGRLHAAKLRRDAVGKRNLDPETLRRLDSELSSYQLEALRQLHDTLNLDEETREKVRNYRSFDRFLLGETGSWSRSGSYGGFMVNAEEEEGG